jgi:dienelactone hydrolase
MDISRRQWMLCTAAAPFLTMSPARGQVSAQAEARPPGITEDDTWLDRARQRSVPVRIRWPAENAPMQPGGRPVVLFSHGLGGTAAGGERWGQAWCAAGLVVVHLQHPGSDLEAVRRVARSFSDQAGLRRAAGPEQLLARLEDVVFALDEMQRRQAAGSGRWSEARVQAVGMSGHSFGAHTTLGMAGQRYPGHPGMDEPRLAAFMAFSPTLPARGDPAQAFARLTRPLLCITGTHDDDVAGNGATPERRMGVFAALPQGRKAQLVLEDADHMTFAGNIGLRGEGLARHAPARTLQAQHHALVAAITTDWWHAHLLGDAQALGRLTQPAGLAPGDRWQTG